MGAEFILIIAEIPVAFTLADVSAMKQHLQALVDAPPDSPAKQELDRILYEGTGSDSEYSDQTSAIQSLRDAFRVLETAATDHPQGFIGRRLAIRKLGHSRFLFAGNVTWGDSPEWADEVALLDAFISANSLRRYRFFPPSNVPQDIWARSLVDAQSQFSEVYTEDVEAVPYVTLDIQMKPNPDFAQSTSRQET